MSVAPIANQSAKSLIPAAMAKRSPGAGIARTVRLDGPRGKLATTQRSGCAARMRGCGPSSAISGRPWRAPLQSFPKVGRAGISPKEQPANTVPSTAHKQLGRIAWPAANGGADAGTLVATAEPIGGYPDGKSRRNGDPNRPTTCELKMVDQKRLQEILNYNQETGEFTRVLAKGPCKSGDVAGWVHNNGAGKRYRKIRIDGGCYFAHRLAWLYVTGELPAHEIDHIDGDGLNNRFANLRAADDTQQAHNKGRYRNNTSGYKGVSLEAGGRKWSARISLHGRSKYLGSFETKEAAHAAYCAAAADLHGSFARVK